MLGGEGLKDLESGVITAGELGDKSREAAPGEPGLFFIRVSGNIRYVRQNRYMTKLYMRNWVFILWDNSFQQVCETKALPWFHKLVERSYPIILSLHDLIHNACDL